MSPANDPSTWFCDCFWYTQDVPCRENSECCTNICNNGQCATTGGMQGALCGPNHQDCAVGFTCVPWGDFGYCNRVIITTTSSTTTTETTRRTTTTTTRRTTITTLGGVSLSCCLAV